MLNMDLVQVQSKLLALLPVALCLIIMAADDLLSCVVQLSLSLSLSLPSLENSKKKAALLAN